MKYKILVLLIIVLALINGCGHNTIVFQRGERIGSVRLVGEKLLPEIDGYFNGNQLVINVREHTQVFFEEADTYIKLCIQTDTQINGYTIQLHEKRE